MSVEAKLAVDSFTKLVDDALPNADENTLGQLIDIALDICERYFEFQKQV